MLFFEISIKYVEFYIYFILELNFMNIEQSIFHIYGYKHFFQNFMPLPKRFVHDFLLI